MKHRGMKILSLLLSLVLMLSVSTNITAYADYRPSLNNFIPVMDSMGNLASYEVSLDVYDNQAPGFPRTVRLLFSNLSPTEIESTWKDKGWNPIADGWKVIASDSGLHSNSTVIDVSEVGIDTEDITYTNPTSGTDTLDFTFNAVSLGSNTTYYVYFILRRAESGGNPYPCYRIMSTSTGRSIGTLSPMTINYYKQNAGGSSYSSKVINTHYISGQSLDVSKLGTVPTGYHINTSSPTSSGNWDGTSEINIYYDMDVDISLTPDSTTLNVGGTQALTAAIVPSNATDKTVKWSVGGTNANAVKLYSDANCTTEVGTGTTETLTVYAKGVSAGSAAVTVTSNADANKSASCAVTVNAAGYTVTYVANNGTGETHGPNPMTIPYTVEGGNMFAAPDGMKFVDWLVKGTTDHYTEGTIINSVSGDLELVAQWESVNNGGNQGGQNSQGGDVVFYGGFGGGDESWSGGYVTGLRAYRVSLAPMQGGSAALVLNTGESGTEMNVYPQTTVRVVPSPAPGYKLASIVWSLIDGSASYDITQSQNLVMPAMDVVVHVTFAPVG